MGVKLINLEKGDTVMDVARVVNEDEEPRPIETEGEEGAQEIVASTALEDELDVGDDGDDGLEEAPPALDDLVDEIDTGGDDGPGSHDVTDQFRGEDES
jgi:hypothetical protein